MKQIFTILMMLVGFATQAQTLRVSTNTYGGITTTDSLWFTHDEYVNYVFGNLDMQEVTTNFLLERSLNPFEPEAYDGKNGNDSTIRSVGQGFDIYTTFYYSALDTAASYAPAHPSLVREWARSFNNDGYVPIMLLNHAYHSIKPNALLDGLFSTNIDSTILYDNLSRIVSPYQQNRVFVAGPYMQSRSYASNGDVKFYLLPTQLHFTDTLAGQLQIDFGDGNGYINVTGNTTKSVFYSTSGTKLIKVKQDGMESISEFNFEKYDVFYESSPLPISGGGEGMMTLMSASQPMARNFLGCDNVLDKPILVVEGFEIDQEFDADRILRSLNGSNLVNRLQALGYDFVVVKFSDNAASIYENALALRSAINEVNATKAGNNKLHIIGLSMGGLIAKYCLKDMEDNNLDHKVENYFSYDSPHQGAYVPFGLQHLVSSASKAMRDIRERPEMQFILEKLRSSASRQLLQLSSTFDSSTRSSFASDYLSKGYPSQCNNYGIANGRGDGVGLGYQGGVPLMHLDAHRNYFLGRALKHNQDLWTVNTSGGRIAYLSNKGVAATLGIRGMTNMTSSLSYTAEIIHETVPGSSLRMHHTYGNQMRDGMQAEGLTTNLEYYGRQITTFVPTVSALDLNNQNYNTNNFYISRNPYYDIAANEATVLASNITPFDDIIYAVGNSQEHLDIDWRISNFIFEKIYGTTMPTGCAGLCTTTPIFTGLSNDCSNSEKIITMSNTPTGVSIQWVLPSGLQLISGQGTNSIKIATTATGSFNGYVTLTWPGCTSVNYPFTVVFQQPNIFISGPSVICPTATYNIYNLPTGATVTWLTPGLILSSDNNHITVEAEENSVGIISASIATACGDIQVSTDPVFLLQPYTVNVTEVHNDGGGAPSWTLCSEALGHDNNYNIFLYEIPAINSEPIPSLTLHYRLRDANGGVYYQNQLPASSTGGKVFLPNSIPAGFYNLEVWLSGGPCSLGGEKHESWVQVKKCGYSSFTVYPNPTHNILNIELDDKKTMDKEIILYNDKGLKVSANIVRKGDTKTTLDTKDLPNGNYFLHIKEGKEIIKRQIVIEH